eukprot:CAMPEP_0118657310 /NCGR_PEP_ID=MMETSP0785-20121206/13952_1 /TAXON_ID=91992 /ORGANISM="Bolidomonas pacifica, Strain CCMP 1866" /LENGTH=116 /DNA_ID=CAMNT_0006550223 /DNA_START=624 /DNA_END=974 /DNA_ORIENTATION=-
MSTTTSVSPPSATKNSFALPYSSSGPGKPAAEKEDLQPLSYANDTKGLVKRSLIGMYTSSSSSSGFEVEVDGSSGSMRALDNHRGKGGGLGIGGVMKVRGVEDVGMGVDLASTKSR